MDKSMGQGMLLFCLALAKTLEIDYNETDCQGVIFDKVQTLACPHQRSSHDCQGVIFDKVQTCHFVAD